MNIEITGDEQRRPHETPDDILDPPAVLIGQFGIQVEAPGQLLIERLAHAAVRIEPRSKIRYGFPNTRFIESKPSHGVRPEPLFEGGGQMPHESSPGSPVVTEHNDLLSVAPEV